MRIAMIGQKGIPTRFGGVERYVEAVSTRLGAMGHEVTVYTRKWYAPANPGFAPGVRVVATPTINTKHLDAIVHTFTSTVHAIATGADIIHYQHVGPALLAWIPRVFSPRTKVIVTFQCIDRFHQKWGRFARLMLWLGEWAACAFAHETIVVSQTLQKYCDDIYGAAVTYIPNGTVIPSGEHGEDKLAQFGLEKGKYVAMISRVVRHKGQHHLIAAWKILQEKGLTQGMKLAIVGDSAFSEDYMNEVRALAAGDDSIVFTGYQEGETLAQLFANSYLVSHPSEAEGLPMSVLEAMGYGKCMVASDIPEHMEVIARHGVPFRNKNAADLAEKLADMLADPAKAAQIGAAGREFVGRHYHWDTIAKEINDAYFRDRRAAKAPALAK